MMVCMFKRCSPPRSWRWSRSWGPFTSLPYSWWRGGDGGGSRGRNVPKESWLPWPCATDSSELPSSSPAARSLILNFWRRFPNERRRREKKTPKTSSATDKGEFVDIPDLKVSSWINTVTSSHWHNATNELTWLRNRCRPIISCSGRENIIMVYFAFLHLWIYGSEKFPNLPCQTELYTTTSNKNSISDLGIPFGGIIELELDSYCTGFVGRLSQTIIVACEYWKVQWM